MNQHHYSTTTQRFIRRARVLTHTLHALWLCGVYFPMVTPAKQKRAIQKWSHKLLTIFNIQLRIKGIPPQPGQPGFIISNHISWLDIYVIDAVYPARFIAKIEISHWPVYGWIARKINTIFINRSKRSDTARVNQLISDSLQSGDHVAVFGEGTTSDGQQLLPFHGSLMQAPVMAQAPVYPVGLRYLHPDGRVNVEVAFVGDISFGEGIENVLTQHKVIVEIIFGEPFIPGEMDRKEVAKRAQETIAGLLNIPILNKLSVKIESVSQN